MFYKYHKIDPKSTFDHSLGYSMVVYSLRLASDRKFEYSVHYLIRITQTIDLLKEQSENPEKKKK